MICTIFFAEKGKLCPEYITIKKYFQTKNMK